MRSLEARGRGRISLLVVPFGLLLLETASTSCANTDEAGGGGEVDASNRIAPDDASADADAGECDGGPCTPPTDVDCSHVEWCPAKTSHPSRYGLSSIWGSGPNDVWAVGAFGSVTHWDGTTWTTAPIDAHASLRAVWGTGPDDVWTMSAPNQIYHSTGFVNGAAQWTAASPVISDPIDSLAVGGAIWGTGRGDIWILGRSLPVQRPDDFFLELGWRTAVIDGAPGWAPVVRDWNFEMVRGIWGSGPGDVWIVGNKFDSLAFAAHSGGVAAAEGGVPVWTEIDVQAPSPLYAVWGSGAEDVWAVGDDGTIRHFTANARFGTAVVSPTRENLRGIWGTGPNDIWAVGENGTILHYDGATWKVSSVAFASAERPTLYGVWGSSPSDVWAVGSGVIMQFSGAKVAAQGEDR